MEMALQPQSLLCPRSRLKVVIRPASSASGGGLAQEIYWKQNCSMHGFKFRKAKRTISLHTEVASSRGYAPRIAAESSIQEREHINNDEETFDTYNRLLRNESTEWKKLDTTEVDLSQDVSSSSMRKVDATDEAKLDILEDDLPRNLLNGVTMGEVDMLDEAGAEDDVFEVDLSALHNSTVGKMDAVNEVGTENDLFEVDLSALHSAAVGKVDVVDGAKAKEDLFEMDSLALHSVTMGKVDLSALALNNSMIEAVNVMDEAKAIEDTLEVELSGNATSSSTYGEVKFEVDSLGNTSSTVMYGPADGAYEPRSDEVTFKVDSSENASNNVMYGRADVVDESWADEGIFEVDFFTNASSGAEYGKVDVVDEAKTDDFTFEIDSLEKDSNNKMHGKAHMVDEAWDDEAIFEVDLFGNASSIPIYGEVNVLDEARADDGKFEVDLLGNTSSNSTHEEVDVVDEAQTGEATFEVDLLGNALSSAIYKEVPVMGGAQDDEVDVDFSINASITETEKEADAVDEARVEDETFDMDLVGKQISIDSMNDDVVEEGTKHHKYPMLSSAFIEVKTIHETPVSLKPELMSVVMDQEQDKPISSVYQQEGSIFNLHAENQSTVDFHEREQMAITFDKQKESVAKLSKEDQQTAGLPEKNMSFDGVHRKSQSIIGLPFQHQSIVSSPEKYRSIVGFHGQNQSIISSHKQDKSIVGVPKKIQSIVGSTKHDDSIVGFHKQDRSIVSVPEQKQSIVGFHKQDLSIVAVSKQNLSIVAIPRESQSKQISIVRRHDPLHLKEVETKDRDGISKKSGGDDDLPHMLFEEELSQVEDEARAIAYKKQHEVDVISLTPDIQESPQDNIDPQELRRMLQELADQNCSMGNKLFVFPEAVKANSTIDVYLNRNLSALANEPDVHIKGAFNSWRWRPFTERLHKSELSGDWWSCKLHIPKEAYRLDFVFFNGRLVYDNNDSNDFVLQVESTMDEDSFEEFLVEEKKRELERVATEEAERRRHAEEQQRMGEQRAAEQAAREQAKKEIELKKNKLQNLLSSARTHVDNLWHIEPSTYRQGDTVRLYYNRNSRPLMHSTEIWMHGGCNSWTDGLSIVERLVECDDENGDWWYANVHIPEKAFVLDWVFADGPPGNARNYDNNGRQDFHAILPNAMTNEEYWVEEENCIYTRLLHEIREREEAIKIKVEKRAKMKSEMKEKTMRMFLLSQKHIVYTEPLEIRAGTTVDVLYNPSNTVLNGKPEVWFRWSFNRWMHPSGVLPPKKMVKTEDGCHLKATVSVPSDAYMMDFVFSESEEGGIYDNRNGTDYHIPVSGSNAKEPPIHIVHIAVEMAPIAKVGGLADVVTSLSRAIQELGHHVEVILPKYNFMNQSNVKNLHVRQSFSLGGTEIKVWFGLVEDLSVYFLEPQNGMFGGGWVYGGNDAGRFGLFCQSALEFLLQSGSSPHIIHCHDWSSAPVAWLYKEHYAESRLATARIIFTIHNLEFGAHFIGKAMTYCDKATTVSHTYSKEVAGHGAIAPHRGKFYGILNGIDPDIWDPYTDNFIPMHYTSENVVEGKNAAKRALQQRFGLQQTDVPIVGIITRLTAQKGIHLIKHALHRTLERNGQVVLLGSAPDPRIQSDFCRLADSLHGENHGRIYAGSDFILVPSIFEPCGLTQLVAMRYGSIPIVRKTGGLYDTVFDVDHDKDRARVLGLEPNGFSFDGADCNEQSLLGLKPAVGSTPSAKGSWSKTGPGTGLPWTTLNCTIQLTNFEAPIQRWQEKASIGRYYKLNETWLKVKIFYLSCRYKLTQTWFKVKIFYLSYTYICRIKTLYSMHEQLWEYVSAMFPILSFNYEYLI
uniref:starch synthase n=1 Tax=Oryza barthii TaxID=65489 RepID=A0A0D3GX46_9ORYZ